MSPMQFRHQAPHARLAHFSNSAPPRVQVPRGRSRSHCTLTELSKRSMDGAPATVSDRLVARRRAVVFFTDLPQGPPSGHLMPLDVPGGVPLYAPFKDECTTPVPPRGLIRAYGTVGFYLLATLRADYVADASVLGAKRIAGFAIARYRCAGAAVAGNSYR
ncbi:hypothetical protein C8R44DRAFT_736599 [Mycena epipterygia]|nr:hypothetical protein C8R44DRAFT_736599 [Mycena epipterygia]